MNAEQIYDMARDLSHTNDTDFPNTRLVKFLNQVKNDLFSYLITGIDEDWNWDIWTTASVVNQSEYVLPEAASDTEGNLKISSVSINYNWLTYPDGSFQFIKAKLVRLDNLPYEWNYYTNNQPHDQPIYYVADQSIFIAPYPTAATADSIQLKGIKSIVDYTTTTPESSIHIPLYLHDVLVQWLLPYINRAEWKINEAQFESNKYKEDRNLAVKKFTDRAKSAYYMSYPYNDGYNDNYLINLNN